LHDISCIKYITLDLSFTFGINDWDIAAAALVLAECGATLSCADGQPLIFNTPSLSNDGLIASNAALYDQLLTRMAPAQARIKERGLK